MEKRVNDVQDIDELISQYGDKTDDELMEELISVTKQQKQDGIFNEADLTLMQEFLMPMLDDAQAERFKQILEAIKQLTQHLRTAILCEYASSLTADTFSALFEGCISTTFTIVLKAALGIALSTALRAALNAALVFLQQQFYCSFEVAQSSVGGQP